MTYRLRLAQQLMQQGTDTSPIQHWTQGLSRLANTLAGSYVQKQDDIQRMQAQQAFGGGNPADIRAKLSEMQNNPYAMELLHNLQQQEMARQMQIETKRASAVDPSSVREYQYFNSLPPEQKQRFMDLKRSQQIMNLGGTQAVYNPLDGGIRESFAVTPKPEQMPEFKGMQSQAVAQGKAQGEAVTSLQAQESQLPNLKRVVDRLSELGQKATYTTAGRARDTIRRELGQDVGEGAVAREEYISIVNNQLLPLLRITFGAQFTEREGESLKATLGSPNLSPKEKDAVLRSFIEQKKRNIQDLRRQTNMPAQNYQSDYSNVSDDDLMRLLDE